MYQYFSKYCCTYILEAGQLSLSSLRLTLLSPVLSLDRLLSGHNNAIVTIQHKPVFQQYTPTSLLRTAVYDLFRVVYETRIQYALHCRPPYFAIISTELVLIAGRGKHQHGDG